jgi:hypothetical protein
MTPACISHDKSPQRASPDFPSPADKARANPRPERTLNSVAASPSGAQRNPPFFLSPFTAELRNRTLRIDAEKSLTRPEKRGITFPPTRAMTCQDGEPPHVSQREYAVSRDAQDPLSHLRKEFHIPTKAQVKATSWTDAGKESELGRCGEAHNVILRRDSI